jgi:hypothetical protein
MFLLSGVQGDNRDDISAFMVADNFLDAEGMITVDGEIYVLDIDRIVKMVDENEDGFYETHQEIGTFPYNFEWFGYAAGPVWKENKFWFTTFSEVQCSGWPTQNFVDDRGSVLAMGLDGNYDVIASGLRAPNGIAMGLDGEVFVTDNQGGWRPASPFIHVKQGENYGYRATGSEHLGAFFNEPVSPPAVWGVYREVEEGPTGPYCMPTGMYKGQFFCGDIGRGGLDRWFVEEINGEMQGGVQTFTGGLEVGVDRVIITEDGTIYAGGTGNGDQSNQGWLGTRHGLQKLTPNNTVTFEILRTYLREGGIELEFTKPVYNEADQTSRYSAEQWENIPDDTYGGGHKQNGSGVNISGVQVSEDRTRVFLEISGLKEGFVLHIFINDNYQSQDGDNAWAHHTWYTMNQLSDVPPFTVFGCIDQNYEEYNSEANTDDGSCQTLGVEADVFMEHKLAIHSSPEGVLITAPFTGQYSIQVKSIRGKTMKTFNGKGAGTYRLAAKDFISGIYFVNVNWGGHKLIKQIFIN